MIRLFSSAVLIGMICGDETKPSPVETDEADVVRKFGRRWRRVSL